MLTQPLRQTAEYQSLLAAVAGPVPAAAALFGLPPTARAQVLAALCEDTGQGAGPAAQRYTNKKANSR